MKGRMVVVEGLDGVGKTTVVAALATRLGAHRQSTPGSAIRAALPSIESIFAGAPLARQLFFASTVVAASEEAIVRLAAGQDVVIDRYLLSTLVYAGERGPMLDLDAVALEITIPDLTVLIQLDEAERKRRVRARAASTDEDRWSLEEARRRRLGERFRELVLTHPVAGRGVVVDATGKAPEELVDEVVRMLEETKRLRLFG